MFETRTTPFLGRGQVPAGYLTRLLAGLLFVLITFFTALPPDPVVIGVEFSCAREQSDLASCGRAAGKPTLSLVEQPAADDGVAGARLAIDDNNTTGK